jgi:hypothetical protein
MGRMKAGNSPYDTIKANRKASRRWPFVELATGFEPATL